MTDRIRTLSVQLDKDYRTDDAELIIKAIEMIKGISSVVEGPVIDMSDWSNRLAIRSEIAKKLWDVLREKN